ncbi:hypothetical protein JQ628_07215 [Bradyrhizobium lablabi]|uniref:hypothetical protein n=1 Tax=Bradyrhizobium lablabi TaxID=722472 RepID=UPI001BA547A8|nr:hypothetical protein [Bradyrhizobium lablabi]MBR1121300.1 hypothetical protein [Bradyrhizobium lablabi]
MFLVAGPSVVALIAALTVVSAGGPSGFASFLATIFFLFTFAVAAMAVTIDGALSCDFSIPLRASLTAIIGAAASFTLASYLFHCLLPPLVLSLFALCGAVIMGACSLLAHDYGGRQRAAVASAV